MSSRLIAASLTAAFMSTLPALACERKESEPNNKPSNAMPLTTGACVAGNMAGNDQDAFIPQLNDNNGRMVISSEGAGFLQADLFALTRNDEGDLTDAERIASTSTPIGGGNVEVPLSLIDGDYIIGLSRAGGTVDYSIALEEAASTPEKAAISQGGSGDSTIEWEIDEAGSKELWNIAFSGSSVNSTTLVLRRSEGGHIVSRRTNGWGRIDLSSYGLDPGSYTLHIDARDESTWQINVTPEGQHRPEREREPNDNSANAQPFGETDFIRGRLSDGGDQDHYLLELEDGERRGLRLRGIGLDTLELCVSSEGGEAECRNGRRRVGFEALETKTGVPLLVSVSHDDKTPLDYQLSLTEPHGPASRALGEPNSSRSDAHLLPASGKAEGRLLGTEYDSFMLETKDQATWRVNVTASENLGYLTYDGGRYGNLTSESSGRQATLDSLVLPAGRHLFTMRGKENDGDGRYYIEATRLGEVSNDRELEPNNDRRTATPMSPGDKRSGALATGDGSDGFLISTETATPMRVTLEVGEVAGVEYEVYPVTGGDFDANVEGGSTYVMERRFEAGESMINIKRWGDNASYTLSLEAIDRGEFASRIDREPNNSPETAGDLPLDGRVKGGFDDFGEWARYYGPYDIYRLPDTWASRSLIVTGEAGGAELEIVDSANDTVQELSVADDRSGSGSGKLPGKAPVFLRIEDGKSDYDLTVWPSGETPPDPSTAELSATLTLQEDTLPLAAHWAAPQPVGGTIKIINDGDEPATARLDIRASLVGTHLRPDAREIEIPGGETRDVSFSGALPENLPARRPVSIIADVTGAGRTATEIEIPVEAGRAPKAVASDRGIPDSMLGGLNIAAATTGGFMLEEETRNEDEREDLATLIDGMVGRKSYFQARIGRGTREPVVAIGFENAPVTGLVIYPHPNQVRRYPGSAPSHAVVETRNGSSWEEVWRGSLATGLEEIVLPFDSPVQTDGVRLRMRNYGGGDLTLSEIKVIASPDYDPTDGEGYEIGAFGRGGEMLGGVPPLQHGTSIIRENSDKTPVFRRWNDPAPSFTTAFRFHRRAEITRLDWSPVESNGRSRPALDGLLVQASSDTLSGPWDDVGKLTRDEPELVLDNPVEARYLRFVADAPDADLESVRQIRVAKGIRVYERAQGNGYTSTLGFYGHGLPRRIPELPKDTEQGASGEKLTLEAPVFGIVDRGTTSPEYEVTVPEETNRIVLAFNPAHTILPQVRLMAGGEGTLLTTPGSKKAEALRNELDIPEGHALRIIEAKPGKHVLQFSEPRRSLLVTWDTSGSIGSFRPAILRSLDMLSAEVDPEVDAIGLLPFGSSTLLGGEWHTERETIRTLLRSVSEHSSSSATTAIETGLSMLETRPGARGLLVITDMDDPTIDYRTRRPYDLLRDTGTLLFGGQINGGGLGSGQTLFFQRRRMRGMTLASDGSFSEVVNPTQIVDLFETAMGRLRGPKPFEVTAYAYDQAPPPPGKLAVTLVGNIDDESATALKLNPVEIVLDASGSMLQRLPDGRRRITAAKASIRDLVTSGLPEATPAALRVFGHLEPDSCDTRLVRPLAPLSEEGFVDRLDEIQARNLAKTPIAESLQLVAQDLEGAAGIPLIVLLTDGDETCDGDPEAVLKDLKEEGLDIRVNIVGFAVGAELDETFSNWAEAGNGKYFEADDADSLTKALETAVRPEFEVIDSTGETLATATTDGEPIELPVGRYNIVFTGGQTRTVEVVSDKTTTLEISAAE